MNTQTLIGVVLSLVIGAGLGYWLNLVLANKSKKGLEQKAKIILEEAEVQARKKLSEIEREESKLLKKEDVLAERDRLLLSREKDIETKKSNLEEPLP